MEGRIKSTPAICRGTENFRKYTFRKFLKTVIPAITIISLLALASVYITDTPSKTVPSEISYISRGPIFINGDSDFTPANGVVGGGGTAVDPFIIENWSISASSAHAIEIINTNAYFTVRNCFLYNGSMRYHGVTLFNVNNGTIFNNTILNNAFGIELNSSDYNNIVRNNCSNNNRDGIHFWDSDFNSIYNNTITNNSWYGIYFDYSDNNTLVGNFCWNNSYDGIFLGISDLNFLIYNNCLFNKWCGIHLEASSFNIINDNNCSNNSVNGVSLWWNSNSNMIFNNVIMNNTNYGCYLTSSAMMGPCAMNIIWDNTFCNNKGSTSIYNPLNIQGWDDHPMGMNMWDFGGRGNYWHDWTTPDIIPPIGIVDNPYILDGGMGNMDMLPLTTYVVIPEPSIAILVIIMLGTFLLIGIVRRKN